MNKDKKLKKDLDTFLDKESEKSEVTNVNDTIVMAERSGLVERIEKKLVTASGKELLCERNLIVFNGFNL